MRIELKGDVRGKDVFIIQSTCRPVNDNLMELMLMISTMRRSAARRITAVIPYYGYARQDRKMQSRVPISAADVARLLEAMGVDRVVAVDLHCGQIQGFFGPRVPVDNLEAGSIGVDYFAHIDLQNPVIVSPDAGGVYRAKQFRDLMSLRYHIDGKMAMIIKQRSAPGEVECMDLVGTVKDCDAIIVDDMIDTAGTLGHAAGELKKNGARRVYAFASHGVFSGNANKNISKSCMEQVVICNTIPINEEMQQNPKIKVLTVASLLAAAIRRIHSKQSMANIFSGEE